MHLILGTAQLDGRYGRFRVAETAGNPSEIIGAANKTAFTALDVAPVYRGVEKLIGESEWVGSVHTKFDPALTPAESATRSIRRLKRKAVDVIYFHDPDVVHESEDWSRRVRSSISIDQVRRIGVSVYTPSEARAALKHEAFEVIQIPLNVADGRWGPAFFEEMEESGRAIIARSIFLQGALANEERKLPPFLFPLRPVLEGLHDASLVAGRSIIELSWAWAKEVPGRAGVVVGAETRSQLADISAAFNQVSISPEERKILDSLSLSDEDVLDPRRWPNG